MHLVLLTAILEVHVVVLVEVEVKCNLDVRNQRHHSIALVRREYAIDVEPSC